MKSIGNFFFSILIPYRREGKKKLPMLFNCYLVLLYILDPIKTGSWKAILLLEFKIRKTRNMNISMENDIKRRLNLTAMPRTWH